MLCYATNAICPPGVAQPRLGAIQPQIWDWSWFWVPSKDISSRVNGNVIAQLELELAYFEATEQHFSCYFRGTSLVNLVIFYLFLKIQQKIWKSANNSDQDCYSNSITHRWYHRSPNNIHCSHKSNDLS